MPEEIEEIITKIKETEDFFHKAKLIAYLQTEKKISTKKLSEMLGIKPAYLCHITRLNKLPEIVVDGYYSKLISVSHLFIVARLKDKQHMLEIYEKVLTKGLTVLQTEELIREYLYSIKSEGEYMDKSDLNNVIAVIKKIDPNLDMKIVQTRVQAKVIFEKKGSLKETSIIIKSLLEKITS